MPWEVIAPHLDRVLDLQETERAAWLEQLATTQPDVTRILRDLLAERERAEAEGFLAHRPFVHAGDPSLVGIRVGAYTIERLIGRGGMGEVWLAARSDGRFEGQCAIKFLDASIASSKVADRFRREGQMLGRLTHPNIARLLDAGTSAGRAYLALEYVDGLRIDRYCEALPMDARVRLFVDVVAAVAHAHTHLIVHRDLKPSNVLVTDVGEVKLLDFGIAKLLSVDTDGYGADLTKIEDAVLTPEYAAPEQLLGEPASTATDVYQLGMLLYVLLTGRHPLPQGGGRAERIRAAIERTVPRASDLATGVVQKALRGDLDAILGTALRRDPLERYATAQALQEELIRYLNREPVRARRGAAWYRTRKFIDRHRFGVAASTVGAVGLCAALVFALVQGREATVQRDSARKELARATAANDFATFMLSVAAPGGGKFSAGELLEQSEILIDKQFAGNDPLKAEMLATVGTQYMMSQRWNEATRLLERAHQIAVQTTDPALEARTDCPLALLKILNGNRRDAEAMMYRALEQLPQRPEYAQLRAECLTRNSEFGFFTGESAPMIRNASAALQLLDSVTAVSAARRLDAQSALAYGYYLARDNRKADEAFARLIGDLEAAGMERTMAAADNFNNWSLVHFRSDIRKAEPLIRRAVELHRSIEGPDGVAPQALFNYAGVLIKLGRYAEAVPVYEETIRNAEARQELMTLFDAMMQFAELHILSGRLPQAEAQLAKLTPYLNNPRFDVNRRAQLAYYQGHLSEARGDLARAREHYADSVRKFDAIPEKIFVNVDALCGLARVELARGDKAAASQAAERALEFAKSFAEPASPSYLVGTALLAVGDSQRASGQAKASTESFLLARENLEQTLGLDHYLAKQAREKSIQ
jgi:serine/threonine-protein kinase